MFFCFFLKTNKTYLAYLVEKISDYKVTVINQFFFLGKLSSISNSHT